MHWDAWSVEVDIGHSAHSARRRVGIDLFAFGPSSQTLIEVRNGGGAEHNSWLCPRSLNPSTGLTLELVGGHTNEQFSVASFRARAVAID